MSKTLIKIILILLLLALNIILIKNSGTGDVDNWLKIIQQIQKTPVEKLFPHCLNYDCGVFYPATYPPGHFLIIYIFTKILPVTKIGELMTFKLTVFIFYLMTLMSLLYFNSRLKAISGKTISPLSLILLYLFTFSVILNSQALGYSDVFFLPFFILGFIFILTGRYLFSGLLFGISILIKWQPVIILPILLIYLLQKAKFLRLFLMGMILPVILILPLNPKIFSSLSYSFFGGALSDPIYSQALNLSWINTYIFKAFFPDIFGGLIRGVNSYLDLKKIPGFFYLLYIPKFAFLLIYSIIALKFRKFLKSSQENTFFKFQSLLVVSMMSYLSYFFISTGVHENHFILVVILQFMLYLSHSSWHNRLTLILFDLINFLNLFIFYGFSGLVQNNILLFNIDAGVLIAVVSFITYLYILIKFYR